MMGRILDPNTVDVVLAQDADGAASEACAEVLASLARTMPTSGQTGATEQNSALELMFCLLCDQNKEGQISGCLALSKAGLSGISIRPECRL